MRLTPKPNVDKNTFDAVALEVDVPATTSVEPFKILSLQVDGSEKFSADRYGNVSAQAVQKSVQEVDDESVNSDGSENILVTDLSASRTITILTEHIVDGREFLIKDAAGLANTWNIVIVGEAAEEIDGGSDYTIDTDYGSVRLVAFGGALYVI